MLKHYSLFLLLVRQNILLLCEQIFKHSDICLLFQSLAFGGVSLRLSLLNFIDIPLNGALLLCLSPIQQTLVKLVTLIHPQVAWNLRSEWNSIYARLVHVVFHLLHLFDCQDFLLLGHCQLFQQYFSFTHYLLELLNTLLKFLSVYLCLNLRLWLGHRVVLVLKLQQ